MTSRLFWIFKVLESHFVAFRGIIAALSAYLIKETKFACQLSFLNVFFIFYLIRITSFSGLTVLEVAEVSKD